MSVDNKVEQDGFILSGDGAINIEKVVGFD